MSNPNDDVERVALAMAASQGLDWDGKAKGSEYANHGYWLPLARAATDMSADAERDRVVAWLRETALTKSVPQLMPEYPRWRAVLWAMFNYREASMELARLRALATAADALSRNAHRAP